jgi:hypothetical protein
MKCQRCQSERVIGVFAGCQDRCVLEIQGRNFGPDYIPRGSLPFGSGDEVDFKVCLECGQMQGKFPIETPVQLQECSTSD